MKTDQGLDLDRLDAKKARPAKKAAKGRKANAKNALKRSNKKKQQKSNAAKPWESDSSLAVSKANPGAISMMWPLGNKS